MRAHTLSPFLSFALSLSFSLCKMRQLISATHALHCRKVFHFEAQQFSAFSLPPPQEQNSQQIKHEHKMPKARGRTRREEKLEKKQEKTAAEAAAGGYCRRLHSRSRMPSRNRFSVLSPAWPIKIISKPQPCCCVAWLESYGQHGR